MAGDLFFLEISNKKILLIVFTKWRCGNNII